MHLLGQRVDFIYGWFLPDRLEGERVAGGAAEVLVEVGEVLDAVGRGLSSGRLVNGGESVALNECRWRHLSANVTLAEVEHGEDQIESTERSICSDSLVALTMTWDVPPSEGSFSSRPTFHGSPHTYPSLHSDQIDHPVHPHSGSNVKCPPFL